MSPHVSILGTQKPVSLNYECTLQRYRDWSVLPLCSPHWTRHITTEWTCFELGSSSALPLCRSSPTSPLWCRNHWRKIRHRNNWLQTFSCFNQTSNGPLLETVRWPQLSGFRAAVQCDHIQWDCGIHLTHLEETHGEREGKCFFDIMYTAAIIYI